MRSLRFSIAGLMGVVLLVALGSAALRNHSEAWSGALDLVTRGVLCLAFVGAICRSGAERTWWLGFASFGWIYFGLPFGLGSYFSQKVPTNALLKMLAPMMGVPIRNAYAPYSADETVFYVIGHCLWALLAAVLGGLLASALFGSRAARPEVTTAGSQPAGRVAWSWWVLPSVILLSGLVLITSLALAGARLDPALWAGSTYLLTWWLLGLAALGALFGRGRRREVWLGATLFGAGFMIMVFSRPPYYDPREPHAILPTVQLIEAIRPHFETVVGYFSAEADSIGATNARIQKALNQRVPMRFTDQTTLEEVLKYIQEASRDSDRRMIPIYVDPIGLQEAEKFMTSKVRAIDLEGVRLRTSLRLCLSQLELAYLVKDGLLLITSVESENNELISRNDDPFQIVGHCLLALIAAALGGAAAPLVCDLARRQRA